MKNLDTVLLCLEINSIALGYKALSSLSEVEGVRIIEATAIANRLLVFALGPSASALKETVRTIRSSLESVDVDLVADWELVEAAQPKLLDALFSLVTTELEESLVIVDSPTASGLLHVAHSLAEQGLKPIEVKIQRSAATGGHAFFTGASSECLLAAEHARVSVRNLSRSARIEVVEKPNQRLREFFNFAGEA